MYSIDTNSCLCLHVPILNVCKCANPPEGLITTQGYMYIRTSSSAGGGGGRILSVERIQSRSNIVIQVYTIKLLPVLNFLYFISPRCRCGTLSARRTRWTPRSPTRSSCTTSAPQTPLTCRPTASSWCCSVNWSPSLTASRCSKVRHSYIHVSGWNCHFLGHPKKKVCFQCSGWVDNIFAYKFGLGHVANFLFSKKCVLHPYREQKSNDKKEWPTGPNFGHPLDRKHNFFKGWPHRQNWIHTKLKKCCHI